MNFLAPISFPVWRPQPCSWLVWCNYLWCLYFFFLILVASDGKGTQILDRKIPLEKRDSYLNILSQIVERRKSTVRWTTEPFFTFLSFLSNITVVLWVQQRQNTCNILYSEIVANHFPALPKSLAIREPGRLRCQESRQLETRVSVSIHREENGNPLSAGGEGCHVFLEITWRQQQ